MRGLDVYLDNVGAISLNTVLDGLSSAGADAPNKVAIFEQLMDSQPLVITANTSTLYAYTGTDLIAAIGIVKGKPFKPDARMKKLLVDAGALGNATSRAMTYQPRIDGMSIYPDSDSAWVTLFAIKNTSFEADGTMGLGARVLYCFNAGGVTPAMAVTEPVAGSDYAVGYLDADKPPMDGGKSYKLTLPKDVHVNNFWAETIYHAQTRPQLQTSQKFPTVGSLTTGMTCIFLGGAPSRSERSPHVGQF
ncbi:DUF1214 domain-containing protein [Falsihalocynthiibacter arcticus]|nr:DUF1214 domain-containing protein [Falsihalocynthiibacter arcticus]